MTPFDDPQIPALLERLRRAMIELRQIGRELGGSAFGSGDARIGSPAHERIGTVARGR